MDQEQQNQIVPESGEENISTELIPITRIGVETELSRYPIHNLSKKGRVDIQIIKRTAGGQVDLKWEVSYSERHGQARQFAYKLDTIVINRRIDKEDRPLPETIRLGSLRELAEELGLDGSGDSTNRVKKALHQNAGAYITAKIKYRTNDGGQRLLEAGFSRYSVIFTGEQLPDGREADAVYLVLNKPFREVLNNAPIRPLNYDYLKALPPAPQRFYEIISSRVYAAQKNRNPFARILYSEFCIYSALTRHLDHENFRVQMAKILRPHMKSGYIAKVQHEPTTDQEGNLDWMMCFQPGPRARAEYMTFARKSKQLEAKIETIEESQLAGQAPEGAKGVGASISEAPAKRKTREAKDLLLVELTNRGIAESRAKKLLAAAPPGQQVIDQLEWGDFLIQSEPGKYKNTAGFYIYLLSENVVPPFTFETSRQKKQREEAQAADEQQRLKTLKLQDEYEDYQSSQVEEFIRGQIPEQELAEIIKLKRQHLATTFRSFRLMPAETVKSMVWGAVKAEIKPRVKFLSLAEFVARKADQPGLFDTPPEVEQGNGVAKAPTPASTMPAETPKQPLQSVITPQAESITVPPKKTPYRANLGVTEAAAQIDNGTPPPGEPGSEASLGASEVVLLERYREFQRKEARRALDRLEILERGRRMKTGRAYLLGEHPEREHYQHLIAEGEYEEFHRISEDHLLQVTAEGLKLPDFEDWKRYALSAISAK